MRPIAMAEACARAMTEPGTVGVVLTVQKGRMPRSFPRGELLNEMERDGLIMRTLHFKPDRVLAWLVANGLVEKTTEGNVIRFSEPNAY